MKYRLSILNGAALLYIIGCIIYTAINYEGLAFGEGWGVAYMVALVGFGLTAFVVDLVLQLIFKKKEDLNLAGTIALVIYVVLFIRLN